MYLYKTFSFFDMNKCKECDASLFSSFSFFSFSNKNKNKKESKSSATINFIMDYNFFLFFLLIFLHTHITPLFVLFICLFIDSVELFEWLVVNQLFWFCSFCCWCCCHLMTVSECMHCRLFFIQEFQRNVELLNMFSW